MRFILIAQMALTLFCGCNTRQSTPNVIIIFTDDQGYGDLGCYGAKGFETPNIDKINNENSDFLIIS